MADLSSLLERAAAASEARRSEERPAPSTRSTPKLSWKDKQELAALPDRIAALEAGIAALHERLADPATWAGDAGRKLTAELGCTFYDSAEAYGNSASDRLLGELLKANPSRQLFTASKVPPKNGKWPSTPNSTLQDIFPREQQKTSEIRSIVFNARNQNLRSVNFGRR